MAANSKTKPKKQVTLADLVNMGAAPISVKSAVKNIKTGGPADPKVRKLTAELTRQRARIDSLGGGKKKGGPSIMNRVFDVLSRGTYASANIAKDIVGGPKGFNPASAGWQGLSGKKKTTYSGVLEEAGVKNKWVKGIAGLVGDIALDPTTYLGVGLIKAPTSAAKAVKGAKAAASEISVLEKVAKAGKATAKVDGVPVPKVVKESVGRPSVSQQMINKNKAKTKASPTKIESDAIVAKVTGTNPLKVSAKEKAAIVKEQAKITRAENVARKADVAEDLNIPDMLATVTKAPRDARGRFVKGAAAASATATKTKNITHAEAVAEQTAKLLKQTDMAAAHAAGDVAEAGLKGGAVRLTFGFGKNKKVLGESEKLYKGVAKAGKVLGATEVGSHLNKTFRTKAMFPDGTNDIKRVAELRGVNKAEDDVLNKVNPVFEKMSKEERELVNVAIDEGIVDTLPAHMQEAAEKVSKIYEDMRVAEVASGVIKPEKRIKNYVYHGYRNRNNPNYKNFKNLRAVGTETPGYAMERSVASLRDAKAAGLDPVMDAREALTLRIQKHHEVMARKDFVYQVSEGWGVKPTSAAQAKVIKQRGLRQVKGAEKSPFLDKDMYFPDNIAKTLEGIEELASNRASSQAMFRMMGRVQNEWKFLATAANPGHHFRNVVGDVFNNYLDGVVDPNMYKHAAKLIKGGKGQIKIGKDLVDYNDIRRLYRESGAKSGFFRSEMGTASFKPKEKIRQFSDARENFTRMAHFVDAMKKEAKGGKIKSLDEISDAAAMRVRKWNIDYGDLTEAEKKIKNFIPFYTWSRKNIPLQLEALAMRPGRVAAVPKTFTAVEKILGTDEYSDEGPIAIPKWLRDMAPIRLSGEGQAPWVLAPALPIHDIGRYTEGGKQGILRSLVSQVSPMARIPIEQATGTKVFSGAPVGDNTQYLAEQVPMGRIALNALTKGEGPGGRKLKADQILNYLTGAGAYQIDPSEQASELRRQQDPLQAEISGLRKKAMKKKYG